MSGLRILNLEDEALDSELIQATLEDGEIPCEFVRVQTREKFVSALEDEAFDLILSDHSLPSFDGFAALRLFRERDTETPFILVSGALGEEFAIESLKNGATDYVLKQRLERLVPAVRRAIQECEDRAERRKAEEALREARGAERSRIAREMHDTVLQDIVYALQEIQAIPQTYEELPQPLVNSLDESAEALRGSVESIREAIFELRLEETAGGSIRESLASLIDLNRRMARRAYEIELVVEEDFPERVPPEVAQELLRIIREALTNARRHASPSRISVRLGVGEDHAWAEIADDGRGFEPGAGHVGIGSHSMRQRARKLGAELIVDSAPGRGTLVRLRLPRKNLE